MSCEILYARAGNTSFLRATITDEEGDPVVGADAAVSIFAKSGTAVVDDLPMLEETAGVYRATLAHDLDIAPNASYTGVITAVAGAFVGRWEIDIVGRV